MVVSYKISDMNCVAVGLFLDWFCLFIKVFGCAICIDFGTAGKRAMPSAEVMYPILKSYI